MAFLACFPGSLDLDTRISHGLLMHFDAYEFPENPWLIRRPPWTLRMFACMHQPSIAWKTTKVCYASYVGFLCFRIYPCNIWDSWVKKEWSFREAINLQDWDSTLVFPLVIRFSLVFAWVWKFYQWLVFIHTYKYYLYILSLWNGRMSWPGWCVLRVCWFQGLQVNKGNGGCYTMHTDSGISGEEDGT